MPRRREVQKRPTLPDPIYKDKQVTRFINGLMLGGKKSLAERVLYNSLEVVEQRTGQNGLEVLQKAINNVRPIIEVKSRRVGGATYQVPIEVAPERKTALAIRWLLAFSRKRSEHTMADRLALELIDAHNGVGASVKKREDTHRMADANKAFAHFRF